MSVTEHPPSFHSVRGVVFDLDGTLLDTLEDIGASLNGVLAAHRLPMHPIGDYRQFVGEGVRVLVERAVPADRRQPGILAAVLDAYREAYARRWHQATRPYPGIPELLRALQAAGRRMAVLSNKPDDMTQACMRHYFPDVCFAVVRGQREGAPRKPDPAAAHQVADAAGLPASAMAMVGDSGVDMRTGRAAGLRTIGVLWGFRDEAELNESGAEIVVRTPEDLRRVLTE